MIAGTSRGTSLCGMPAICLALLAVSAGPLSHPTPHPSLPPHYPPASSPCVQCYGPAGFISGREGEGKGGYLQVFLFDVSLGHVVVMPLGPW